MDQVEWSSSLIMGPDTAWGSFGVEAAGSGSPSV